MKIGTGLLLCAMLLTGNLASAQSKSSQTVKTEKMKEYIFLIRLPIEYGFEQAAEVRAKWTTLTDQWKEQGIFVSSFVFPSKGSLVYNDRVVYEEVTSNDLKVISSLILKAENFEAALLLAKKCPILEQGGAVEVREIQPRPQVKFFTDEEMRNKEIVRNLYENILNDRKYELLENIISPDYQGISSSKEKGAKSFLQAVQDVITAFPEIKWEIQDMMADRDKVILRWNWTASNTQPFRKMPATNKTITNNAIVIYQLKDGKITNTWIQGDQLSFLMQMGLIPQNLIPGTQIQK